MDQQKRRDYRDLVLWQRAIEMAAEVHRTTFKLPRHEMFGMAAQIRRAALSVPSNIAEGSGRRTTREFIAFLHIARGSLSELKTQLVLTRAVGYLADADLSKSDLLSDEVGRLLNAVIRGLRRRQMAAV